MSISRKGSRARRLVLAAGAMVVLLLLLAVTIKLQLFKRYITEPLTTDLVLELSPPIPAPLKGDSLNQQHVDISGTTTIASHVKLILNRNVVAERETGSSGDFSFPAVSLRPGQNDLEIRAQRTIAWRTLEESANLRFEYQPLKPSKPILSALPEVVNSARIKVNGIADPSIVVRISATRVVPAAEATGQSPIAARPEATASPTPDSKALDISDSEGRFSSDIDLPVEGVYKILAQASNSNDQASEESTPIQFRYDKAFYPKVVPIVRKITITVGYREITTELEATLPRDNPALEGLITGKLTAPEFVERVFGFLTVNGYFILGDFSPETIPAFKPTDQGMTVTLHSNSLFSASELPPFTGSLEVLPLNVPAGGSDTLILKVKDYGLQSVTPLPSEIGAGSATWTGANAQLALQSGVEARITSNISSHPLRLFQLSPNAILPQWVSRYIGILQGVFPAIPIVWLLWLLKKHQGEHWSPLIAARVERASRWLVMIALIPMIIDLTTRSYSGALDTLIYRVFGNPPLPPFDEYLLALLLVAAAILLLVAVSAIVREWRAGFWARSILKGMLKAWLAVALLCGVAAAVLSLKIGHYQVFTTLIFAPFVLLLLVAWTRLIRPLVAKEPGAAAGLDPVVFFSLLIASLLLTYPTTNIYYAIFNLPAWSGFFSSGSEIFGYLSNLTLYVLLPGLLLLIKDVAQQRSVGEVARENEDSTILLLGALIFSCYLIGLGSSWFWIPVPFILSLFVFPRMVLLDAETRKTIAKAQPSIISERSRLIKAIASRVNARDLLNALIKLEKKFTGGDLALNDYLKRRKQIEEYLQQPDGEKPLVKDRSSKDIVLAVGPFASNWENGWWAVKKGAWLVLPLLAVYTLVFLVKDVRPYESHLFLSLASQVVSFVGDALIGAFFFGFFFNSLRGSSGLRKGINISAVIILCLLPAWIAPLSASSLANLFSLLFRAGQTFLFFTILGIWAFDYRSYRDAVKSEFQWKKFAQFGDMPSATTFLSVTLTSLGVTITTVLTGQFTSIITEMVKAALPNIPTLPTK